MARQAFYGSRAFLYALLLSLCLFLPACAQQQASGPVDETGNTEGSTQKKDSTQTDTTRPEFTGPTTTVEAVRPEDILSEEERTGAPKFKDFNEKGSGEPVQLNTGTSAGAIPAVKPFNFGRDPGGPSDKTLYLTVPKLGISAVPVFDSVSEDKLAQGTIHIPATGFPWQDGANVYIAGHRLGYPDTRSLYVFYDLDKLAPGDEISLTDSAGSEYNYKVTEQKVVPPENVEVMNAVEGKSLVTLQTCTLPDFTERVVVQGELVS